MVSSPAVPSKILPPGEARPVPEAHVCLCRKRLSLHQSKSPNFRVCTSDDSNHWIHHRDTGSHLSISPRATPRIAASSRTGQVGSTGIHEPKARVLQHQNIIYQDLTNTTTETESVLLVRTDRPGREAMASSLAAPSKNVPPGEARTLPDTHFLCLCRKRPSLHQSKTPNFRVCTGDDSNRWIHQRQTSSCLSIFLRDTPRIAAPSRTVHVGGTGFHVPTARPLQHHNIICQGTTNTPT